MGNVDVELLVESQRSSGVTLLIRSAATWTDDLVMTLLMHRHLAIFALKALRPESPHVLVTKGTERRLNEETRDEVVSIVDVDLWK